MFIRVPFAKTVRSRPRAPGRIPGPSRSAWPS